MNDKRYRYILYTITLVIIVTIGIQVYWNYKNYLTNKQQLINDVQISLDRAVDGYYANLAEKTTLGISFNETNTEKFFKKGSSFNKILTDIDEKKGRIQELNNIEFSEIEGVKILRGFAADSMMYSEKNKNINADDFKSRIKDLKEKNPDIKFEKIKMLTSKVMISITNDTLNLKTIDSLLKQELNRKKIAIDFNLNFKTNDGICNGICDEIIVIETDSTHFNHKDALSTLSKSTFLPNEGNLSINFTNETKVILARMLGGISISTLLVFAIISCLFYLLKIINKQKQLAEIKNDLISNITHEFKTPIATIGAALEGINNFNIIDDKEKTKKYIDMSSGQLSKLNLMVEKLLETATLDSESLNLKKEELDIITLLTSLSNRYQTHNPNKSISTNFKNKSLIASVDVFHFENALNNILDNAIKYGGNSISIEIISNKNKFTISISDNGTGLTKANKERIFEKFYRIPKGNQHDVKGFGIGLYYTKSIIEKHEGTITLNLKNKRTTFKIELPNG